MCTGSNVDGHFLPPTSPQRDLVLYSTPSPDSFTGGLARSLSPHLELIEALTHTLPARYDGLKC